MKPQDENRKLREYIRQSKQRRRWHRLTAVLATAAAVLTLCVMVLPAVTLENTPQALACQLDDLHTHTDSCYDEEGELVCGYADFVAHTHDSSCYGEDGTLICPLEERKPHTHTESCYQETETLVCGREETQGHTHTESCYETQLVCSQEESQGHTHTGHVHTDACYTVARTPICESTEPDHVHTEECSEAHRELTCTQDTGCYDENGNLICGLEETQGHTHSEDCYDTQLVCGQEETEPHTHTDSCYQVQRELVCGQEEVILHTHTEDCRDEDGNLTCGMVEVKEHVHDETCLPEEEVAPHTLAAQNEAVGTDFRPYITSTQVQVKSGDQWVDIVDGTVTDGSSIQVTIYYSITDSNIVTADNNIIYYQLPNGIRLTEEENGPVEVGDKNAGTYTITRDGLITITFNKDFADGSPFSGNISFHGEVSLADIEEGDDIVFGGAGGTITIVPDAGDTSLHIEKTGDYNQAEGKMYYTVTVSSEDGSDGTIHYTDKFLNPTGGIAYEEESIRVLNSARQEVEVEIDFQTGSTWFEIPNLPQLGPGESYTITYTATVDPDDTTTEDGSLEARNQASAADESNQVSTIHEVEISGPRIEKIGVYNPSTREVVWTVYIYNPRGYNLAGKTLSDTMTWTYGGKTLTQNIESATLTPYTGETPGESVAIELPYEFPANSTQSYILTYTTSLPEDAAVGANLSVTNTAWLGNWKAEYNIDGTVPGKTGLVKTFTGQGEGDAVKSDLNWSSIITFPQGTLKAGTLDSVRYVDIIQDAVNEGWQLRAGTHYTTPELLRQLVVAPVEGYNQQAELTYGTDYTIQVVTAADFQTTLGETYYNATGVGYVFKTVAFDQLFNGFTFDGKTYQFNWQDLKKVDGGTPIAMFAIEFTEAALTKVNKAGQISISYSTHYDLSKVTGNGTYTLVNGGRTPSNSAAANTETALLAQLNKQVSTIGGHDYALESNAYTDGPAAMDVGDTDGNIYYRILLYNFGDEISLQDTMWATQNGGNISVDSIQVYDPITGNLLETLEIWGADGHFGKENDYYGIYNLKNLAAYRGCIIGLYYHVDVSANLPQGKTETITNTVKWTGVAEDSVETTVTNSKPTLEKDSSLDEENNRVYYYVTINPGAKDLHPESDRLQLEDTLTLPNGVSATLLPNTIQLFTYNSANGSNHYLGDDITDTTPVFAVVATEGKENSYTFTVPDGTACVVVYAYEIDRGTYAGDNIEVRNAAMLMGSAVISAGDEIQLDNQGSSSQANEATLTIYKIGGNDVSNLLDGVLFDLFRYEEQEGGGYKWVRTDVTAEGPPAGDGGNHFITGGDNVEGAIILNFLDEGDENGSGSHYNTLYRLTEFKTLPGYKLDTTPRYYVWGRNGATEESTQASMADVLAKAGVTWDKVTFIPYGGSETQTIANEPTTTEITVTKTWQGAEGTPLEEDLPDSVEVTLYQQTAESEPMQYTANGVTNPVTLTAETNWTYTWEQLPKEVDGQAVTYTVVETPITGWEASYDYGEGATGILEGTVIITNTKQSAFTLPETGGVGPTLVAIAGVPLVGAAGVVYWNLRRKRRRGGEGPISKPLAKCQKCIVSEYVNRKEQTIMKKARKLTAVLLSLVMLLALVIPASAAENYSITIQNNKTGHTYEAYQIFAGTVSDDETDVETDAGPMLGDITWGSGVDGAALLAALKAANAEKYNDCTTAADVAEALGAEGATAADAAAFADIAAKNLTETVEGTADAPEGGNYVINNLPAGYYLVKDSLQADDNQTGQVLSDYIVQVLGNVTMDPKDSDIPTLEKKVAERSKYQKNEGYGMYYNDVADWNIGDSVPFKLIASIPNNIESYDEYKFVFHDTLSNAFTLERDSIKVFVAEATAATVEQFEPQDADLYQVAVEGQSFTLTIPDINQLDAHGNPANYVIITYSATLNQNAEIGLDGNENTAYLEFSNDPNGDGLGRTAEDTVIVFTYELDGTKVDGKTQAALQNAKFVLLNGAKTEAAMVVDGKVKEWVKVATEAAADDVQMPETYEGWLELNQQHNGLILTSAEGGTFKIAGLDDGTYFLREIQAPNGYNLLEEDVQLVITATTANGQDWNSGIATDALKGLTITVDNGAAQNGDLDTGIVNVTVENNRGATLPETGGMGTTLFYIIGGLLVVGAGILLVVRIRMKAHNE